MDNNVESSDYESVYESSDTEYDSDISVSHGFSESKTDFDDSSYDIATNLVTQTPDLGKLTQTSWSQVTESENGHVDFQLVSLVSGTKHIQNCDKPTDLFYLFYSPYLWNLIMENTNKYAKSVPIKKWKDVTVKIMKVFMAVVFNMGLVRKNEFTDYWSTRQSMNIIDSSVIPARDDPSYRPSVRLRPLLDYMNNICMHYFFPGQAVAIDESLVAGKVCNPI